jgi:hypothetical protein
MTTVITQLARLVQHVGLAALALCLLDACQTKLTSAAPAAPQDAGDNSRAMDAAAGTGERVTGEPPALPGFCARPGADAVRELFCTPVQPTIRGVRDLEILLGFLSPEAAASEAPAAAGVVDNGDRHITAALGHSTALSGQLVSPLNPRLIVLGAETIMAFQRGIQRIELISRARDTGTFNFYLVDFEQACNQGNACSFGDLYTPRIESNWLRVSVRNGEDLANTPQDCRACHQRGLEAPTLLMRELQNPWTHFFVQAGATLNMPGVTGSDLLADYLQAKGDEGYGGIALATISSSSPFVLQNRVGSTQPLVFDAPTIFSERYPYGPDGFASEALPSPTWQRAYDAFKRGEQLASPYLEQRASDQAKQAKLSEAYQRYRAGTLGADELPDLADIFPDDPHVRAQIGLQTEPDASAADALIQACGSCHNDVLDQSLSRARFNIAVSRLDRAELALAVERIERAPTEPGAMPPSDARQLDPSARARLLDYLRQDPSSLQADSRLERAAQLGMAGGETVTD